MELFLESYLIAITAIISVMCISANACGNFWPHSFMYIFVCALSEFSKRFIYAGLDKNVDMLYYFFLLMPEILLVFIIVRMRKRVDIKRLCIVVGGIVILVLHGIMLSGLSGTVVAFKTYLVLLIWLVFDDAYYLESPDGLHLYINMSFLFLSLCSVYGLVQVLYGYFPWEIEWFAHSPTGMKLSEVANFGKMNRAFSVFSGVQEYSILVVFFGCLYYFMLKSWTRCIFVSVSIVALLTTGSKTTIMALIFASGLYFSRLYRYSAVLITVCAGMLGYVYTRSSAEIFQVVLLVRNHAPSPIAAAFDPITLMPRIAIMAEFFQAKHSLGSILIGSGIGSSRGNVIFDNSYLMIFSEIGVIGLFIILGALMLFYNNASRIIISSSLEYERNLAKAMLFFIMTAMICMFFSQIIAIRSFFLIFVSSILVVMVLSKRNAETLKNSCGKI